MTLICLEYFSAHIFMAIGFTLTVTVTSSLVTFRELLCFAMIYTVRKHPLQYS